MGKPNLNVKWIVVLSIFVFVSGAGAVAKEKRFRVVSGEVLYQPPHNQSKVATRFQLKRHRFPFEQKISPVDYGGLEISMVTFPSPVKTPHENNNTVHCEFFRPIKPPRARIPGVIVLHILGGDFELSRAFCHVLAHSGAAALFVKLPYYGPRRQPGVERRMVSPRPEQTVESMTQAVLDLRRATAWLAQHDKVDGHQLGIFGISLGGITAALTATAEPRLKNICLLLAGGDISRVAWESPDLAEVRRQWEARGKNREEFVTLLQQIDPVRYGANVRSRRILMLNAKDDKVIPRSCTISLWKAFGEPPIHWYDGGHYSVAKHILSALSKVARFFGEE